MGLVSEAIMTELGERDRVHDVSCDELLRSAGYQTRPEAEARLVQSLTALIADWPRETFSGFMVHFTNRNLEALRFSVFCQF